MTDQGQRRRRARVAVAGGLTALVVGGIGASVPAGAQGPAPGGGPGSFTPPFVEPTIAGKRTDEKCVPKEKPEFDRELECKPAAGSLNVLPSGDPFYWDALEGTENVNASIVAEYGRASENDESRLLRFINGLPTWDTPTTPDGGANPDGEPNAKPLIPGTGTTEPGNDGALFCADQNFLADGRILAAGGTAYLNDPGLQDAPVGATELAGVTSTRIYDPSTNSWSQAGRMKQGRWYPTLVTMGDGRMFTASGVEKLIKPIQPDDPKNSGGNVRESEIFDPKTNEWTQNPATADRSLPLFPRLHLLPNGKVFYNAAGQSFNPAGQDYAEAQWNVAATYDPAKQEWKELGVPGLTTGVTSVPGFRGSTSSTMLPLEPDDKGRYTKASFLTAGGVPNPPSPGGYIAVAQSQVATVDTAAGDKLTTEETGPLSQGRWYGSQILLPTGEVVTFSGADRDEVIAPGVEVPRKQAELFDPATKKWRTLASGNNPRTYHNTAALMPDGRVLVGGHAPISTLYGKNVTVAPGVTGPNDGRDPSFEIFSPPYLSRGDRPVIESVASGGETAEGSTPISAGYGKSMQVFVTGDASKIANVTLVRFPTQTHVVDGDQRSVRLRVVKREGGTLTVAMPEDPNVLPPGPYMMFVNRDTPNGPVPSVSTTVFAGTPVPAALAAAAGSKEGLVACASKVGFQSVEARGRGRGLALGFTRVRETPVGVDVFQHAAGRTVVRERLVARFSNRSKGLTWNGRATQPGRTVRDGLYSVRFTTRTASGKREVRRVALRRSNGRWSSRPDFYRRVTCDVLSAFKLERPAFAGRGRKALGISYRLASRAKVRVEILRGGRTVKRLAAKSRPGQRTFRLSLPVRGTRRGDYKVKLTVTRPNGRRLVSTLTSRRL